MVGQVWWLLQWSCGQASAACSVPWVAQASACCPRVLPTESLTTTSPSRLQCMTEAAAGLVRTALPAFSKVPGTGKDAGNTNIRLLDTH